MTPNVVTTIFAAKDLMSKKVLAMQANVARAGQNAFSVGRKAALTGALIAAPLVLAAREAVKFEDKMSDIAKTTGLEGKELTKFGDDILQMSTKTRSSIEDLSTIAEIGGRLGIAKKDLKGFTVSANEFAVALGGDFSGGVESAITEFGKLKNLFRDTKGLDVSESLKKSGSAFNALSAKGVNVEGLTDFSLRVGALPEVLRPSLASASALGATLQKSGVDAQIASSGFSNFITTAGQNLPAFAKQMKMSQKDAVALFNTDSATFFAKFSASLKGVPANELAVKLKNLKLNSLEVQKAVGAMAGSQDLYNELLGISNEQMQKGTSITKEYNTKNNNTAGQFAKLRNNLKVLAITVGNALLPVVNSLIETISPILKSTGEWMRRNKGLVSTITKVALGVAALSFAVSGVSFVIGIYQKAVAVAKVAQIAWNVAMMANPIALIVVGVAALAVGIYALSSAFDSSTTAERINSEVRERALEKTIDQRVEIIQLFSALRKAKTGTEEYTSTLKKIDAIQPGITKKYMDQNGVIRDQIGLQKELTANIMKRAEAEVRSEMLKESIKKELQIKQGTDETTAESVLGWLGEKDTVKKLKALRLVGEKSKQDELTKQISQQELGAQPSINGRKKDELTINFNNAPEGTTATKDGQTKAIARAAKPVLGFTR